MLNRMGSGHIHPSKSKTWSAVSYSQVKVHGDGKSSLLENSVEFVEDNPVLTTRDFHDRARMARTRIVMMAKTPWPHKSRATMWNSEIPSIHFCGTLGDSSDLDV